MSFINLRHALNPHRNYKLRRGKSGAVLGRITENAAKNQALYEVVSYLLPDDMQQSIKGVSMKDDKLVLRAVSSAWATRLKFLAPNLLKALHKLQDYQHLNEVSVVIVPN